MQVILEPDEAWSIMTLVVSQVLDNVELSAEARREIKRWRTDRAEGTAEMSDLAIGMNEALGNTLDEKTRRLLRRKGWYVSSKET
ncbi:MAG: hypothetical protein QME71_06270 [Dehalococcoidia bacterium]|nr:hypothetical protein [Dehalococcoidia bacterium]